MVDEKVEEKTAEEKAKEIGEILKKPIAEIDAMAKERGLNPGDYPNIEELAKAIEEKPMEPEKPEEESELDKLLKLTRNELDDMAKEKGLDPSDYRKKEEVATAILESE